MERTVKLKRFQEAPDCTSFDLVGSPDFNITAKVGANGIDQWLPGLLPIITHLIALSFAQTP